MTELRESSCWRVYEWIFTSLSVKCCSEQRIKCLNHWWGSCCNPVQFDKISERPSVSHELIATLTKVKLWIQMHSLFYKTKELNMSVYSVRQEKYVCCILIVCVCVCFRSWTHFTVIDQNVPDQLRPPLSLSICLSISLCLSCSLSVSRSVFSFNMCMLL